MHHHLNTCFRKNSPPFLTKDGVLAVASGAASEVIVSIAIGSVAIVSAAIVSIAIVSIAIGSVAIVSVAIVSVAIVSIAIVSAAIVSIAAALPSMHMAMHILLVLPSLCTWCGPC